ncbi:uncharacterized protein LOC124177864 isoform X1 [Neodiprion fabricii]|uniref:uncharacterized protein LOC124177864 isoform X1 n=2 Tax=Neodiprion fabricii TaxID=2872261 RepID=UPI001ED961FC|nr:uncharacterized protein LOC124177864 isoform X1 [Neodiprion fabricii]
MRAVHCLFILLVVHGASPAIVRKGPAFATPIYSDAIMPAAMQVIFHAVGQLKIHAAEEEEETLLRTPSTSPHPPGQRQPLPAEVQTRNDVETSTISDNEKYFVPPERYQEEALIIAKPEGANSEKVGGGQAVTPEANHEESEVVYGLPETNYELPERDQEVPEKSNGQTISRCRPGYRLVTSMPKESTVDSVVRQIYNIMETSSSGYKDVAQTSPEMVSTSGTECIEAKNPAHYIPADGSSDDREKSDEDKDDARFTLLGERVDQVPNPSLVAFLRAGNATTSPSLLQLSELYDVLSKDARRQGYSKYAGYSDKVLKFLQESSGGEAGVQLRQFLEKAMAANELSRYDSMTKTKQIIAVLKDPGSRLSTDLRNKVLPMRFVF